MLDSLQSDDHCKAGAGGQVRCGGDEGCARAVPAGGGDAGATGATTMAVIKMSFVLPFPEYILLIETFSLLRKGRIRFFLFFN